MDSRGSSSGRACVQYAGQGIRENALLQRLAQDLAHLSDSGTLRQVVSAVPAHQDDGNAGS